MRKGVESLCRIVHTYHQNPLNGGVYVLLISPFIEIYCCLVKLQRA